MKGYKAGVQAQLLRENPKAFFTPCGCHNLNLVLADIASVSPKAVTFFGVIQRFYTFLSASNYRYDITKKYLKLTPKTLSDTRWECRVESVKAVRFQIKEFVQIFEEILTEPKDPKAASEATSLLKEIQSFPFILSTVIWYELLVKVNRVSKMLQQRDVQMDVAISLLDNLLKELLTFREDGYQECVKTTKIIAEQNNVIPHFPQKRVARSKRPFDYESVDDPIRNEEEQFRIEYFLLVTDQAIASFKERFKLYEDLRNNFGFLYDFRKIKTISKEDLMKNCMDFHNILQDGQNSDVDGADLLEELLSFIQIVPENSQSCLLDVLNYLIESKLNLVYPNIYIAIRILLTIPVTIASAERSFSKLKLIKNYLRSNTSQERLVGLAMMSIEKEISHETDFSNVINDFASAKARKVNF
ncbi:zinc finger MYM-type protein 1-like [Camponotus floridanus]|nr:zinc finger MYM-type protein 1-like [Camponotus floridanus]